MNNSSHPSTGGPSEHNERSVQDIEREPSQLYSSESQLLFDNLLERGFEWEEAVKLLNLREHLYDNSEMQQRMNNDKRMQFARWLYEQGEILEA